jgi:glycosyltransferase involved in cell wall biosynthesis
MKKIAINAHLLSSEPGYRAAGIHNYLHQLLLNLPAVMPDDWQISAMVSGKNQAHYKGITMRPAAFDTMSPAKRILWEQMIQPFQLGDTDLYHAGAFVAPYLLNKPMIVTVYDLTFMRYPERLSTARRLYLQAFTETTCQRAKRILAISQSSKQDLIDLFGIDGAKIDVTPLGYDPDIYQPLAQGKIEAFRKLKQLPQRFWLFLGTLEPRKNLVTLIEAYARLPENERLPLILAGGKGWLTEPIFVAIEKHGLSDAITTTGFVPTDEIALWYNSAELFIYPSVFEGFGLPVLEAMACGTAVITSNVSSLPEVAQDAGKTLAPHEVEIWVEALQQAYHDSNWRKASRQRGLQIAQTFTWQQTARLTVEAYRKVLNPVNPSFG